MKNDTITTTYSTLLSLILMCSLFMGLCNNSYALESDRNKPVLIEADIADLNQSTGKHIFRGNVTVIQGSSKLFADRAHIRTDKNQKLIHAVAYGSKAKPARFITIQKPGEPPVKASAHMLTYLAKENKIALHGNAKVQQGTDNYSAPQIIYDITHRHVTSYASKKQRVSILIHPKNHQSAAHSHSLKNNKKHPNTKQNKIAS